VALIGPSLYGKRVVVLAGKGNNGSDGRRAAPHLERLGARCQIVDVGFETDIDRGPVRVVADPDLIIDACFGTGLRGRFDSTELPLAAGDTPVLAVDIPSGVDGLTGELRGHPLCATATVTFAAAKPGLLLDPGRRHAGEISVADIGLDCSRATIWHLNRSDVVTRWPRRELDAHKWQQAVYVVGGSPGLTGAPSLCASAALRSGAGYVACSVPPAVDGSAAAEQGERGTGTARSPGPIEAVSYPVGPAWSGPVVDRLDRFGAAVIGPGLTIDDPAELGHYLDATSTPTVLDAGAIDGLAGVLSTDPRALARADGPLHVLTPHEGEFERLVGERPGPDRIAATVDAARRFGAVVLLKGSTTVVADPDGRVLLSTSGDRRLATAGTGDVLAGVIAAGLAGGLEPFLAAGVGAELHGSAGIRGYRVGMTAGDLPSQIAELLSDLSQDT
jgi:NAD(P)H-hydrate epimerase